jgi:hypothetical protein
MAEAAAQMESWAKADPEGFEAMMAATLASKEAGDDPETAMKKLEAVLAAQQQEKMGHLQAAAQAAAVAQGGVQLPSNLGGKKVGLDGKVVEDVAGLDITPTPAFVVKTKRTGGGPDGGPPPPEGGGIGESGSGESEQKVFLNLCTHEALGEPHLKKKLDESGKEVEGWNIPLSVGPPRLCTDQKGDKALVYDCVVNPKVVLEAQEDETGGEKDFLVQLALQYAETKYKFALDRRYKLPKLAYKSSNPEDPKEVAMQRVRDTSKAPSITEVNGGAKKKGGAGAKGGAKGGGSSKAAGQSKKAARKPEAPPAELKKLASRLFLVMRVDTSIEEDEEEEGDDGTGLGESRRRRGAVVGYREEEDTIRATTDAVGVAEPKGADGSEKEPRVRPNGFDDVDDLPREMVLRVGPLGRHALNALVRQNELDESGSGGGGGGGNGNGTGAASSGAAASVEVSVYGCFLNLPGHLPLHVVLPFACVDDEAECVLLPATNELELKVPVDPTSYTAGPDPGSRPWLLSAALEGGGDGRAEAEEKATEKEEEAAKVKAASAAGGSGSSSSSSSAAEDRFHLRAKPKGGVDPLTGLVSREEDPVLEDEELPEDRFHRDDALSSHYIHQREGDRKEKQDKAEQEREERKARKAAGKCEPGEENIDYIDVEDFKPGGKYGPPAVDVAARRDELTGVKFSENDDMAKAKKMVVELASSSQQQQQQSPASRLIHAVEEKGDADEALSSSSSGLSPPSIAVAEAAGLAPERLAGLKSTIWADLLD